MSRWEKLLLQLTVFLIPTNLSYHWISKEAYVRGLLVDYLIPKLYLSDIPVLMLLLLWLVSRTKKLVAGWKRQFTVTEHIFSTVKLWLIQYGWLLIIAVILLWRSVDSERPMAAIWLWLKLVQWGLFFWWLKSHLLRLTGKVAALVVTPLTVSLFFQSVVAMVQFVSQRSVGGYWLLGETRLDFSSFVAKSEWLGNLRIIPYGTTPHPNVLGGFLTVGMMMLWLTTGLHRKNRPYQKMSIVVSCFLSLVALFITQAVSAWMALVLGVFLIGYFSTSSKQVGKVLRKKWLLLTVSVGMVMVWALTKLPSSSVERRVELVKIAGRMFLANPAFGIGLNQFSGQLEKFGTVAAVTRFVQPVHNIYLLWIVETGLVGLISVGILFYFLWQQTTHYALRTTHLKFMIPLLMLSVIGLVDHYPLTLQQGQLLLILGLWLATAKQRATI
ncbi:hypothetical protein A3A66_04595 [Microgenomates group bacterium RIFCSPLOWO2_01_FULL_46_13]|nr:MAG: hypothetical protein A2783_05070 [Microgenomates group bacterium RIFCSPHIGHO2_01_FULL_45_11]OGV94247.1 MAG: hypothetical protein A3A66_04595 [Microgenomates group bacterium RIFCSPLOWO2_01_FULL_46_13]